MFLVMLKTGPQLSLPPNIWKIHSNVRWYFTAKGSREKLQ